MRRDAEMSGGGNQRRRHVQTLEAQLAALPDMSHADLRAEWRRLYRSEPAKRIGRDLLELGVAWKLQEKALGGMSAGLKRRIADLAKTMETRGDLARARAVTLKPGARLMREWRGETHDVRVLEEGFEWRGARWRSLSVIAREITGTQWSGPRFFGLEQRAKATGRDDVTMAEAGEAADA